MVKAELDIEHVEAVVVPVASEDDAGGRDGDVGAGADGDAAVGPGEGGGVVDTVTDHGHSQSSGLQLGDLGVLVLGQHLVDPEVPPDGLGDRPGVTGDHDDVDALGVQGIDGGLGLGPDLVGIGDPTPPRTPKLLIQ